MYHINLKILIIGFRAEFWNLQTCQFFIEKRRVIFYMELVSWRDEFAWGIFFFNLGIFYIYIYIFFMQRVSSRDEFLRNCFFFFFKFGIFFKIKNIFKIFFFPIGNSSLEETSSLRIFFYIFEEFFLFFFNLGI